VELLARVEALARRSDAVAKETILRAGDLKLDLMSRTVLKLALSFLSCLLRAILTDGSGVQQASQRNETMKQHDASDKCSSDGRWFVRKLPDNRSYDLIDVDLDIDHHLRVLGIRIPPPLKITCPSAATV
jgi:hypothetical protein